MKTDKFHENARKLIRHVDDQPILVPTDIENEPIVTNEVHGCYELVLHVNWTLPLRSCNYRKPRPKRTLRLRMPFPKLLQAAASNHPHL
jgi:hypothetical protein